MARYQTTIRFALLLSALLVAALTPGGPASHLVQAAPVQRPSLLGCGLTQLLTEGFESGNLGAFSSNTPVAWRVDSTAAHSGTRSAYASPTLAFPQLLTLRLNNAIYIPVGLTQATLSFWHFYSFDASGGTNLEGGVLEVSTNGGGTWSDAGANITAGGYNGTIAAGSPLAGRQGWTANSPGYPSFYQTSANLLPYAGQSLLFRFNLGSAAGSAAEWRIDDIMLAVAAPCPTPNGMPVLRDFEDLSVGTFVYNQYDGVLFLGGDASTHPVTVVTPGVATISPTRALQSAQGDPEIGGSNLVLQFSETQYRVSLSSGLTTAGTGYTMLLQGFSTYPGPGGAGGITGTAVDARVAPLCASSGPTALTTPLEVDDFQKSMSYAVLSIVSCADPTNPNSGPHRLPILLDNLLYDRPLHPAPRESDPPVVTIIWPGAGSVVTGTIPGLTRMSVQATVTETAIYSMTAQVNGNSPVSVSYYRTGPLGYRASVELGDGQGLVSGTNTVVLRAWDFDRPQNVGSTSVSFNFRRGLLPPASQVDVMPTAYEVTQSIDEGPVSLTALDINPVPKGDGTYDGYRVSISERPPLVQGKATLVRVYGAVSGATGAVPVVPALMLVRRDNCSSQCDVPGGQFLAPLSYPLAPAAGITLPVAGSAESMPLNIAPDLAKTWNFLLPPDWTMQDLVVRVVVNAGTYQDRAWTNAIAECYTTIAFACQQDNVIELHLHFRPAPQITVNPVFIHVTGTFNNRTFNDVTPSDLQVDAIFQQMNELYPARVIRGRRFDRTVSPAINRDDLLDLIDDDFGSEDGHEFFLGVFPGDQGSFAANTGIIPNTSVVGYAAVGGRGAWANADDATDVVHELGHNIGFDHWACENGADADSADECRVFPIRHGGLGGFGTDIARWRVIPRGDDSANNTPHAHDFMSYGNLCSLSQFGGGNGCDLGEWVSWYTYDILLNHPGVNEYDTDDPPAILVRGRISAGGVASLQPLYQIGVNHPISDTVGDEPGEAIYTLQGFDALGNTLFVHNFSPLKLDVHGPDYGKAFLINEVVPAVSNLQQLVVLKGPSVIGSLVNPAPGQGPSVSVIAPTGGTIWPVSGIQTISWSGNSPAGRPLLAQVQYSPDGGATRETLGRDISGSALAVDPAELAGSTNAMIYVQVSDGVNTAAAVAGPFTVTAKAPSARILTPQANSVVLSHVPIGLLGSGFDRQQLLVDGQFSWSSNHDGVLGSGRQLTASNLSVGMHTLTLTITDGNGLKGQDSVQVQIMPAHRLYLPSVGTP